MLNEESRRKIREQVDILDDWEQRPDIYASMNFDDQISLAIDELYARKNSSRAKRLISSAKLRYENWNEISFLLGRVEQLEVLLRSAGIEAPSAF